MNEDYSYFQGQEFRTSLASYERMLATGEPTDLDSETLTDIAEYYAMNQRMDEANRCIQYALSFYPDSIDPQIFLARQQMFQGNQSKAWEICNAIADQDDREVFFLQAELLFYFGESDRALELLYSCYLKSDVEDAPKFFYDAIALAMDYGFGDKAMKWVTRLRSDYPNYADAIALQAEIHNYRREYQQAVDLLQEHLPQIAYDIQAWLQLSEAYLWLEKYNDAMEAVDYALAIEPENADALIMKANILLDTDQLEEAHEYYVHFLRYFPNDERANYLDAQCLIDYECYENAIGRLELLAAQPGSAIRGYVLSYLAFCHDQLKHKEQALHYRQQAEKERNNYLSTLFPDLYPNNSNETDPANCD